MVYYRGGGGGRGNRPSNTHNNNNGRNGNNQDTNYRGGNGNRHGGNHQNNQNRSGYIVCSICNKPGHTADQCWNNPNSGTRKVCTNCGKAGHTASQCWNSSNNGGQSSNQPNACTTCGRIGHTPETCWHNQRGTSNSSNNSSNGSSSGRNGPQSCSFCGKRGHTDDVCFKRKQLQQQQQGPAQQGNHDQAQAYWGRPLKCMVMATDGRSRYPYNPQLRVERRDERISGPAFGGDLRSTNSWAVDSDGDVLMCTLCSGFNLRDEWCLQHCMARIGRQQNANVYQLQKVDEVGLDRAMAENYCPGQLSLDDFSLEGIS